MEEIQSYMIKLWTEVPRDDSAIAKWIKNKYNDIRVPGTRKKNMKKKMLAHYRLTVCRVWIFRREYLQYYTMYRYKETHGYHALTVLLIINRSLLVLTCADNIHKWIITRLSKLTNKCHSFNVEWKRSRVINLKTHFANLSHACQVSFTNICLRFRIIRSSSYAWFNK